jgi:chromosome segregation ATPase
MNAITSRLDALRGRKKEIEESRSAEKLKFNSNSAKESQTNAKGNANAKGNQDNEKDTKASLIEKHREPGAQNLPYKVKTLPNNNSSGNGNEPDAGATTSTAIPDELANAKRRIAELTRILNSLDAQLERTQEELEDAREAADNAREAAPAPEQDEVPVEQVPDQVEEVPENPQDNSNDATDKPSPNQVFEDQLKDLEEEKACLQIEMLMAVDNAGSARRQLDKIQQENLEFQKMLGTDVALKFRDLQKIIAVLQKENKAGQVLAEQIQYLEEKGMQLRNRLDEKEDDLDRADDRIALLEKEKADSKLPDDDRIAILEEKSQESKHQLQQAETHIESLEEELEIANTALLAQVESEMDQSEIDQELRSGPTPTTDNDNVSALELELQAATSRIEELEQKLNVAIQQPTQDGDEDIGNDIDNGGNSFENVMISRLRQQLLSSQRQTKQVKSELETAKMQLGKSKTDLEESQKTGQARNEQAAAEQLVKILDHSESLEQKGVALRTEVDNTQAKVDTTHTELDAAEVVITETEENPAAMKETSSDQFKYLQEMVASLGKQLEETQEELTSTKSKLEERQSGLERVDNDNESSSSSTPPEVQQQLLSEKLAALHKQVEELRKELEEREDDMFLAQRQLREAKQDLDKIPALEAKLAELEKDTDWSQQKLRNELIEREHDVEDAREEMGKAQSDLEDARERIQMLQGGPESSSVDMENICRHIASENEGGGIDHSRFKSLVEEPKTTRLEMQEVKLELKETSDRGRGLQAEESIMSNDTAEAEEVENMKFVEETVATLTEQLKEAKAEVEDAKILLNEANQELLRLKPFESQLADIESSDQIQETSFDAMEQLRGKSAKDKVVALRNELEELRNELEEAQDDAQDAQKRLEEANAEVEHLKQELEQRLPVDSETNATELSFQERFHTLKEEIKDLHRTVQNLQQEKISLSEELDLIKIDRDETVATSQHVPEGRDSGPNLDATSETFGQFKEERKESPLTIQGLKSGKDAIDLNQEIEDEITAREVAEKETAEVKASLVTCQRNLKEANEYFVVLLDTNKQLQGDKRRLILELESAEGAGAVRSVLKKANELDSQDRSLAMEDVALESVEYAEKLADSTRQAFKAFRNELELLRDKIQSLAAEKYQISQERDTANQACQDTKKRVEELEAVIFKHKKNLEEAHSYFQELKEKNSGLQNAIQRVEAEKIELSEETTAAKKLCAEDEARRDQMEESLLNIQRKQEDALQSFGTLRQRNGNLEEENDRLVQERDGAKHALEAVGQRTQEMAKALTTYRQNLEEAHSCFESLRLANEELKDERDAANTTRDEAETRADLLAQTLSTVRNNLDEAQGAFREIQNQNEDFRFKIHIFHEERQIIEDAGDGKFPLLQLITTLKEEISSLKTHIDKGEIREREMQEAMTSHQMNLEEARSSFGTLQSEIDELRTKNAALKELDMENLQYEVEELGMQNQEFEKTQNELETKLKLMETTNAWKLHTNEVLLSQKLDTAVREQRLLEERLYNIQVSHDQIQKTALRLETEKNAAEKKNNSLQDTVGMQGYELLNIRKQLKIQLEDVSDGQTRECHGNSTGS